jgi:predicted SprT family Zn-dependent metalloprotease
MRLDEFHTFNLDDAVKFHNQLNPKIFNPDGKMDPEVREQLLVIAKDFLTELGIKDLDIADITISGSNAAYSYTDHSDLDLHILVDMNSLPSNEVYQELFMAKKTVYNDEHDITVRGLPVELYVQDTNAPHVTLGEYSVLNNKWLRVPVKDKENFNYSSTKAKYEKLLNLLSLAAKTKDYDSVIKTLDILKRYRRAGLDSAGEFGPENLAYKALRNQGIIQKIFDIKNTLHSKKLSIEEATRRDFLKSLTAAGASTATAAASAGKLLDPFEKYKSNIDWSKEEQKLLTRSNQIATKLVGLINKQFAKQNKPSMRLPYIVTNVYTPEMASIVGNLNDAVIYLDVSVFYDLSDDAIAAVIGHELGHLVYGDTNKGYSKTNTRTNHLKELRADVYGVQLMIAAGYNPARAMDRLNDQDQKIYNTPSDTHPTTDQRKQNLNKVLKQNLFHVISALKNYNQNYQYLASLQQNQNTGLAEVLNTDEDYDPNGPPPGPEFKPTMPKGTVRVDVSDVYDWYKLGQHISNLDGLGKHDFGKGPPSTILSFGDEDLEHKYIDALKKTGLDTTDIDPPSHKKIKGQKVDPTYNVGEASGYIPSKKEKNDPRFKTALTVDIKPDSIQQNARAFGSKISSKV